MSNVSRVSEASRVSDVSRLPDINYTYVHLDVMGQRGDTFSFKHKRSTPLKKLMDMYAKMRLVDPNIVTYYFHGRCLQPDQTPDELGLEDGNKIDARISSRDNDNAQVLQSSHCSLLDAVVTLEAKLEQQQRHIDALLHYQQEQHKHITTLLHHQQGLQMNLQSSTSNAVGALEAKLDQQQGHIDSLFRHQQEQQFHVNTLYQQGLQMNSQSSSSNAIGALEAKLDQQQGHIDTLLRHQQEQQFHVNTLYRLYQEHDFKMNTLLHHLQEQQKQIQFLLRFLFVVSSFEDVKEDHLS